MKPQSMTLPAFGHTSGNVLKALIARALSRRFHTKSYFERMQVWMSLRVCGGVFFSAVSSFICLAVCYAVQDAVQKEYFLVALAKPKREVLPQAFNPGEEVLGALSQIGNQVSGWIA